jgi:hypothetical protein
VKICRLNFSFLTKILFIWPNLLEPKLLMCRAWLQKCQYLKAGTSKMPKIPFCSENSLVGRSN